MTPVELAQWEKTSFSGAVPAVATEGQTLFANYLGYVFAVDLASGKMLWRSASFHNLEQATMQGPSQMIDTKRFAILAAPGYVWSLGRDVKDPNFQADFRLVCRRAESGDVIWQSADLPDYSGMDFVGPPILARGTLFIAVKSSMSSNSGQDNQPRQYVLAIRPHDGKLLWKTEVGIFREGERYYWYYGRGSPLPSRGWSTARARSTSTRTTGSSPASTPSPARWIGAMVIRPIPSNRRAVSSSSGVGCPSRPRRRPRAARPRWATPC